MISQSNRKRRINYAPSSAEGRTFGHMSRHRATWVLARISYSCCLCHQLAYRYPCLSHNQCDLHCKCVDVRVNAYLLASVLVYRWNVVSIVDAFISPGIVTHPILIMINTQECLLVATHPAYSSAACKLDTIEYLSKNSHIR